MGAVRISDGDGDIDRCCGILGHSLLSPRRLHSRLHYRASRGLPEVNTFVGIDIDCRWLTEFCLRAPEFAKRNVKVIGLSANDLKDHQKWVEDINDFGSKTLGPTNVQFPIVSTPSARMSVHLQCIYATERSRTRTGKSPPCTTCWTSRIRPTATRRASPSR